MLTAKNLERIIELEESLRAEYQTKLDAKSAELERLQQELAEQRQQLQSTIETQLGTITDLSNKATTSQNIEQKNRELTNRSENLQEEAASLKKRVKALQKDLAKEREQVNALTQYDPARMKKNLDANKKKLAEKTSANELLQKSLNKTRAENAELQRKVQELEGKLPEDTAAENPKETEEEAA